MGKWEMVRLGDVCEVVSGTTPSTRNPELWDGGIKWVTPAEISENSYFLYDTERHISEKAGLKPMPTGTVLLSSRAPIGKVAIAGEPMCCNQGFKNLICSNKINNRYLYRYLKNITAYLNNLGRGATFKEISKSIVESVHIPLPPLPIQQKIANVLDCVNALIEKRKAQIVKLDLLVKSQFIEMFGDPVTNPMGWEIITLSKITSKIGSGATPRGGQESYVDEGISLVRSMNVHNGYFKYEDLAHITDEQAKQLDYVTLLDNDVLLNITGASVARSCIVPNGILPARVNQHVSIIRCDSSRLSYIYANAMLISDSYQQFLLSIGESGGATRQAITKQQIEGFIVILPPLDIQTRFADFVRAADKSKFEIQRSLDKLELLRKSLMQQYFCQK